MCGWVGESGSKERERMEERRKQAIPSWEYISRPPVIKKSASPRVVTVVFFFFSFFFAPFYLSFSSVVFDAGASLSVAPVCLFLLLSFCARVPFFFLVIFSSLSSLFLLMAIYIYGTYMLLYRENKEYKKRFSCLPERGCQRWQPFLYKSREFFFFFFLKRQSGAGHRPRKLPRRTYTLFRQSTLLSSKTKKEKNGFSALFFCFVFVSKKPFPTLSCKRKSFSNGPIVNLSKIQVFSRQIRRQSTISSWNEQPEKIFVPLTIEYTIVRLVAFRWSQHIVSHYLIDQSNKSRHGGEERVVEKMTEYRIWEYLCLLKNLQIHFLDGIALFCYLTMPKSYFCHKTPN